MADNPLVSVIIPTFNRAFCIDRSIRSVLAQTYGNVEVIVVDDASEDATEEVVSEIQDSRIRYFVLETRRGAGGARNFGILKARGEFIAFQDSDDEWHADKLKMELEYLLERNFGMVFCRFRIDGTREEIIPEEEEFCFDGCEHGMADYLIELNRVGTPTMLIRKELLDKYGGFDEALTTYEDWELGLRLSLHATVGYIPKILLDAHGLEKGVNDASDGARLKALLVMMEKCGKYFSDKSKLEILFSNIRGHMANLSDQELWMNLREIIERFHGEQLLVSIIVPIYNVEDYLEECLESILQQPLPSMEVVCVDDGSTDGSAAILKRYALTDSRIKVIRKENSGYGDTVNRGILEAQGEYVGIVESDDRAYHRSFTHLLTAALVFDVDFVKGEYNYLHTENGETELYRNLAGFPECTVLNPENWEEVFSVAPSVWSSLYKKSFLEKNEICFLATPGASYQDTSFAFKAWACSEQVVFLHEPVIDYRVDNAGASSNAQQNIFAICKEYEEIRKFIRKSNGGRNLYASYARAMYESYAWNANRLRPKDRIKFWMYVWPEVNWLFENGYVCEKNWSEGKYRFFHRIAYGVSGYCEELQKES